MTESLIDTLSSPTPGLEPELIARLAADLGNAGWSVDAMETMISPTARAALMRNQRVPALRELQWKDSPAAVLTRFFVLGCAESGDVLAQALPTLGVHGAVDLGLIFPALDAESPSGQQLFKANYDLRPHAAQLHGGLKNWWILSDLGEDVTGGTHSPRPRSGNRRRNDLALEGNTSNSCRIRLGPGVWMRNPGLVFGHTRYSRCCDRPVGASL